MSTSSAFVVTAAQGLHAPPLPPHLSAADLAAAEQSRADARVEDLIDELHRQLPLGIVTTLPGMKQAKRNPGRHSTEQQIQWTRRENLRRLKEAQQAARHAYPPPAVIPHELQLLLDTGSQHE